MNIPFPLGTAACAIALASSSALAGSCTDPANFNAATTVQNRFARFLPGDVARFSDGTETQTVSTLRNTRRQVGGINAWVVNDVGTCVANKQLYEATFDFYAENLQGDVCYLGEQTVAYVAPECPLKGNVRALDDEGTFLAGVDGAEGGTYMPANPMVGQQFYIENNPAQDAVELAEVIGRTATTVKLRITHPLEPGEPAEVKTFDAMGELRVEVPGEPVSRRISFN